MIEKLLHQSISDYDPTCDDAINETMKELLHREVPDRADSFVTSLYAIAQDMTFQDWQDFWLDMGIRVYDAEEDWDFPTTDFTDDTDYDEDYDFYSHRNKGNERKCLRHRLRTEERSENFLYFCGTTKKLRKKCLWRINE